MSLQKNTLRVTTLRENILRIFNKFRDATSRSGKRLKEFFLNCSFPRAFNSETATGIKRRQIFRLVSIVLCALVLSYGAILLFFNKTVSQDSLKGSPASHGQKLAPTQIESATSKADTEGAWRYTISNDLKNLHEAVTRLSSSFEELTKNQGEDDQDQDLERRVETKLFEFESKLMERLQAQGLSQENNTFSKSLPQESQGHEGNQQIIQKVTLSLTENPSHPKNRRLKTVDTTIPAGAFAKTILLSGLDASASMNASSDPRPMLLRLIDPGTLPRRFQSDLKDCHCTASAFGDLSSERIYARLEKLTCIERKTGEIIETQVAGYIAGSDGKAGIRGIVASKEGQLLAKSLVGGVFAGLSNVANPQNRQQMTNPFFPGAPKVAAPTIGENFTSGMASGASSALDRLSQYYIDRAEQLQPVIQVAAGQVVDIVFTEGTFIGSQTIKQEIEQTRESARSASQEGK